MRISTHVLAGAITATVLTGLSLADPTEALGLFWTSALLDVDHFGYYLVRFRDPSLTKVVRFLKSDFVKHSLCVLHTVESVVAFGLFALPSHFLMSCFVGVLAYIVLDMVQGICTG